MRNFIKAELYLTLKNRAYRILFAVAAGLLLVLNFLVIGGAAQDETHSQIFRGRIQGFAFIFVFGIMGMAIVSVIALGDLGRGGAAKNVISNGLRRWKYVIAKVAVMAFILIAYLILFFIVHFGFAVIADGTVAFRENLPAICELLTTMCRACFFWVAWLTVLVAFELAIPNVSVGAIAGLFVAMNGASSFLLLLSSRIPAIEEPLKYFTMRLPSRVMYMFYNAYITSTTEHLFHVPVPDAGTYLVGGAVAILMTAIGILSFRRREL